MATKSGGLKVNFHKRVLIRTQETHTCEDCKMAYDPSSVYCPTCGKKLKVSKISIYANMGVHGITSYTFKLPGGITYNSRTGASISFGNGISYRT